jgi:hypothetical protein
MARPKANPDLPNAPGEKLLLAIARHHALTVEQATYACDYEPTSESYVHEHLLRLMRHGYLRRVIPDERNLDAMYFLDVRGKLFLSRMGVSYDERTGNKDPKGQHLAHRQAVTWVLLKIEKSGYPILEMRNEWQLSREKVKLTLADGKTKEYFPDAWINLQVNNEPISIAIELDRGTEAQDVWREKVLQMLAFTSIDAQGRYPFQDLFGADRIRYAIIAAPGAINTRPMALRANNLVRWTALELTKHKKTAWAKSMFIRPLDASQATPEQILTQSSWVHPGETEFRPLIGGVA